MRSMTELQSTIPHVTIFRDHRASTSIVKPVAKDVTPEKENAYNEKLEKQKSKATRHIILIRHGQYNLQGATDPDRLLTELGRTQAKLT